VKTPMKRAEVPIQQHGLDSKPQTSPRTHESSSNSFSARADIALASF
jgi:hypothetical protein